MYEHLETLRLDPRDLFSALVPLSQSDVEQIRARYPACPDDYLQFLVERGVGPLIDNGEHFIFESTPVSAEREYFQDRRIFERGAHGDVVVFGWESMGTAYGFDTGDGWQIVEVDEYRTVTRLSLSFKEFVEGLYVCYPQIPMSFFNGLWEDGLKRKYVVPARPAQTDH